MLALAKRGSSGLWLIAAVLSSLVLSLAPLHASAESPLGPRLELPNRTLKLPGLKIDPHGQIDPEKPPPTQPPGQGLPSGSGPVLPDCSANCTLVCRYQGKC